MKLLDPLNVDLTGTTLIEASAGTGKTYTITTLFLRLLLEKQVPIDQILVVTFTIAATEELRIKLSERLNLANRWLRQSESIDEKQDPTLAVLIKKIDQQTANQLIGDAVARLDDLSVYTIDAMCLRVLQDFAFETQLPMRVELIADDTDIRIEVARDYWRHVLGSNDDFQIDNLLALAASPEKLLEILNDVVRRRDAVLVPNYDAAWVRQLASDVGAQYREIYNCWNNNARRIKEVFKDEAQVLKKISYKDVSKDKIINWMKTCDDRLPVTLSDKFKLLTSVWMSGQTKKGSETPKHEFFDLCNGFEERFKEYKKWQKVAAIVAARNHLIEAIDRYKSDRGQIHFEDMRTRLDHVLETTDGAALAEKIRTLWPYALIDEFQDTDAEQYRIFNNIYQNQPQCGFFMIGDPKQAVYSWRGADVFTYMDAASQTKDAYTLGVNWRSSPSMVNAVNCLFEGNPSAFVFEKIRFNAVEASESDKQRELIRDGRVVAPMRFCVFDKARNDEIAMACAADITQLLLEGRSGAATIAEQDITPADIAILVRSHSEANLMQSALRHFGVRSVSMPNKSIFQSDEAAELYQMLYAMAYPGREEALRAALVTNLLGYNSRDMELLLLDESRWDELVDNFINARELWLERGFMYALQVLLADLGVAKTMLKSSDGEQRMTNLLQLAELLQIKAREIASHEELMLWLKNQIDNARPGDDALLLRLESDEDLVQIVTMHKSKGLEYPVVFIPFAGALNTGAPKSKDIVVYHRTEDHQTVIDTGSDSIDEAIEQRQQEALSEELRLLYVAVTRSKSACILYWGMSRNINGSALKYLIHQDTDKLDYQLMKSGIDQLVHRAGGSITLDELQLDTLGSFDGQFNDELQELQLSLKSFNTPINRRWGMSSYTGLLRGRDVDMPDHDEISEIPEEGLEKLEPDTAKEEQPSAVTEEEKSISSLPAGARTGQVLHEVYEFMDFTDTSNLTQIVQDSMLHHGHLSSSREDREFDWTSVINTIVINSLAANLDEKGSLKLQQISVADRLNEMEFFFSVSNLDPKSLQTTLASYSQYETAAAGLNFSAFEGLMQGFIDLVVRKDGQYFIVDYKSNWLGETLEHYSQMALKGAINSHRYNLQYLIYTVALHRYLSKRIPDYDYESHFGGVYYLFVRGMRPQSSSGVWFDKPPFELIRALDQMMQSSTAVAQ